MPDFICGENNVIYLYYSSKFTKLCWSCLIKLFPECLLKMLKSILKKHVSSCIFLRYAWWPSCGRSPEQKGAQLAKRNEYDVCTPRPSIYHQSPTRMDLLPQTFDTLTNFYGHLQALGVYIPWPSEPAKFAGWHSKPRVSKQNPMFFYFHKFQDHAPKCSDFINAVGPQKSVAFLSSLLVIDAQTQAQTQQKHIIFSSVPRGSNPCFISWVHTGKSRVEHGLNTG